MRNALPIASLAMAFSACIPLAPRAHAATVTVIHEFLPDQFPTGPLKWFDGQFYGISVNGDGDLVYALGLDGQYSVVHSFTYGQDGANPTGRLAILYGRLFGTAGAPPPPSNGLEKNRHLEKGEVFSATTGGALHVIDTFVHGYNGKYVADDGGLTRLGDLLYGSTRFGGGPRQCHPRGCGTIFSVTHDGARQVVYRFTGGADGQFPGDLEAGAGKLYGTTGNNPLDTFGTIYSLTPNGIKTNLHVFSAAADGYSPSYKLLYHGGALYGTTQLGGDTTGVCAPYGCGTVFQLTYGGKYNVLHRFDGTDGEQPNGALIEVNGTLYGTTEFGSPGGGGTLFAVDTTGKFSVVQNFNHQPTGPYQLAPSLTYIDGSFYGLSYHGGTQGKGCFKGQNCGTAFKITP